jgi:hypothetical protein
MVTSREAIEIIARTLDEHPEMPDEMSYLTHEADTDGSDAAVTVPVVEMQDIESGRDDPSNSNFIGYLTNDNDEDVAEVYETKWEMELRMDIWTAARSSHDVDELGKTMRKILYTYDSRGPDKQFTDETGVVEEGIYDFSLQEHLRDDSLTETPSVRRWRQFARVRGAERLHLPLDAAVVEQTNESISRP